jgi:CheY-like chemotaxis protein
METANSHFNRVMVIDDAAIDRFIAEKILANANFSDEVISLESAMDALRYLESHQNVPDELPQLIFLDINMPEMSGFDFLDEYNKFPDKVKRKCIIVMLSSSVHPEDHVRASESPYVCQFLSKPLTPEKLSELKR